MATLAWIVIVVVAIGWVCLAVAGIFSALVKADEAIGRGMNSLGIAVFGRKRSVLAKLTEPPELACAWPDPWSDAIARKLNEWNPQPFCFPATSWPKWQPLWIGERAGSDSATISDIEALFRPLGPCKPPYELIDQPPAFTANGVDFKEEDPPPEPPRVPEAYPLPILSLPLWQPPFGFLNRYVRDAHADLIARYRQLELKHTLLEKSARNLNRARREAWEKACERHRKAIDRFQHDRQAHLNNREAAKNAFHKARDADIEPLRRARVLITQGDPKGIALHFDLALRRLLLPSFVPRQWMIRFDAETKTLLVEHRFPETARLEVKKIVQQAHGPVERPAAQTVRKSLVPKIQPALCLQLARALAEADTFGLADAIAVNGWVDFFDRTTGQPRRAYCASLIAKKQALLVVRLETADVVAAFNGLHGANAGETYETAPVMPSLRLQTDDPRFVEARDTIEKMAKGENLAAMDWQDFEHLVRELFEREFAVTGAEVKITRASRDQGVDAIIFDPDPLKGGKIVIQAKRYTMPVDVSAVRDLYGTMINEGANTGILVTTSYYGADAYAFAQNKPLKLINGAQLLGLLERAGYHFRIDLAEAKALAVKP